MNDLGLSRHLVLLRLELPPQRHEYKLRLTVRLGSLCVRSREGVLDDSLLEPEVSRSILANFVSHALDRLSEEIVDNRESQDSVIVHERPEPLLNIRDLLADGAALFPWRRGLVRAQGEELRLVGDGLAGVCRARLVLRARLEREGVGALARGRQEQIVSYDTSYLLGVEEPRQT